MSDTGIGLVDGCDRSSVIIDQELDEQYKSVFPKFAKVNSEFATQVDERISEIYSQELLGQLRAHTADVILTNKDLTEKSTSSNNPLLIESSFFNYLPHNEIGFKINNTPCLETIVYQLKKAVDYKTKQKYTELGILKYTDICENEHSTREFTIDTLDEDGSSRLIFINFDKVKSKVFVNSGIYVDGKVFIQKHFSYVNIEKPFLSSLLTSTSSSYTNQIEECSSSSKPIPFETDIRLNPYIIIDPETATPINRELYVDEFDGKIKARIYLIPNKQYFTFTIESEDDEDGPTPLSEYEQGLFYKNGVNGFPKDINCAINCFLKSSSPEASVEIGMLLRNTAKNTADAEQFFQEATAQKSEDALVEVVLNALEDEKYSELVKSLQYLTDREGKHSPKALFLQSYILESKLCNIENGQKKAFDLVLSAATNSFHPAVVRLNCESKNDITRYTRSSLQAWFENEHDGFQDMNDYCLGAACFFGIGFYQRKKFGLRLLEKAASLGNKSAQFSLFEIYDHDDDCADTNLGKH